MWLSIAVKEFGPYESSHNTDTDAEWPLCYISRWDIFTKGRLLAKHGQCRALPLLSIFSRAPSPAPQLFYSHWSIVAFPICSVHKICFHPLIRGMLNCRKYLLVPWHRRGWSRPRKWTTRSGRRTLPIVFQTPWWGLWCGTTPSSWRYSTSHRRQQCTMLWPAAPEEILVVYKMHSINQ